MFSSFSYNYKTLHIYKSFQLIHLNLSSLKTKTNKQIHVSFEKGSTETGPALSDPSPISSRHPCFSLPSQEALTALQERIYEHHIKGVPASAQECDKPGGENSGSKVSLVSLPSSIPPPRFPFHPTFKAIGSWADSFLFSFHLERASSSQPGSLLETLLATGWNSPYNESVVFLRRRNMLGRLGVVEQLAS